jgi:penicillin-binding protein 2
MFEFQSSHDFRKKMISKENFNLEPQEILLDKLAKRQAGKLGVSERKLEVPLSKNVLRLLYLISLSLILILLYRTFQLQIVEGDKFSALAEGNKFITYQIQAVRGVIYDKDFEQLVFNKPSFDLICYKNKLPKEESQRSKTLKEISLILEEDFENLEKRIKEDEEPIIVISEDLSHQKLIILESRLSDFPGFEIENNPIREYKDGLIFSHLIGYTGKIKSQELKEDPDIYSITDFVGRDGLEKVYEDILRKKPGELRVQRDALGNLLSKEIIKFPEPGDNLVLWLDTKLQREIQEKLEEKRREVKASGAVAIALDPNTGGVLSLVSLPSFDNNLFSQGDKESLDKLFKDTEDPLFNRAISGIGYPTGSTIKPLIALAALEEKIIDPQKTINCEGEIVVENPWYDPENPELSQKEWVYHDWMIHGLTDLRKAIAQSCNVYFYHLGGGHGDVKGLGATKIKEYLSLFGWGKSTGIDLTAEGEGTLPEIDEEWTLGDTYHLSIGQGAFAVTPLQVANTTAFIANGGKLLQPQVVQKIVDSKKNTIEEIETKILEENIVSAENLKAVKEGMRQAVTAGSATGWLDGLPVAVAAKTGTAQTETEGYYHNWITVFAPYEEPEIVLTIVLLDVKDIRVAALPLARDILEWYFTQ